MKISNILHIIICICSLTAQAQTSVHTSGGTATGSGGTSTYSIGQIIYSNINGSNGSVNHGVQQPIESVTLDVDDFITDTYQIATYPNPTSENLELNIENFTSGELNYYLCDIQGRTLIHQKINEVENIVTMSSLPAAVYFLKIRDNNRIIKIVKIIKM